MIFLKFNKYFLLLAFELLIVQFGRSQQFISHQPLVYEQKEFWFDQIVSIENSSLINGPEYFLSFNGGRTHPFFGSLELFDSQLWYDQELYTHVHLLYDTYTDKVILRHRDKKGFFVMVELDQTKVEGFTLYHHRFQKMDNPRPPGGHAENGYYDVLYRGSHVMLVAKRDKVQHEDGTNIEYKLDDHYYFVKGGQWVQITGIQDFIKLMSSVKREIQTFVKSNKINARKRNEHDLITLANFCETVADSSK